MAGLSLPAAGGAITAYWALATPQAGVVIWDADVRY
jgi:hypothetical protein